MPSVLSPLSSNLSVRHQHPFGHSAAHLLSQLLIPHHGTDQIHGCFFDFMPLRETVVKAVFLIELMVSLHHALHLPDQIAEDLQTAHTIKEFFGGLYLRVII